VQGWVGLRCAHTTFDVVVASNLSVVDTSAREGPVGILRAAIDHGADVNADDTNQRTPFHLAVNNTLVEAGANIDRRETRERDTRDGRDGEKLSKMDQADTTSC